VLRFRTDWDEVDFNQGVDSGVGGSEFDDDGKTRIDLLFFELASSELY
jgi:hypothetical protein